MHVSLSLSLLFRAVTDLTFWSSSTELLTISSFYFLIFDFIFDFVNFQMLCAFFVTRILYAMTFSYYKIPPACQIMLFVIWLFRGQCCILTLWKKMWLCNYYSGPFSCQRIHLSEMSVLEFSWKLFKRDNMPT